MRKILLYPHGGSGNHGCEAIVRSTMLLLRPEKGSLVSSACGQDVRCGLDRLVRVLPGTAPHPEAFPGLGCGVDAAARSGGEGCV